MNMHACFRRSTIAWYALCLALPSAALAAGESAGSGKNLIVNGSFEDPVVPAGNYKLIPTGQSFTGWEVVGAPGNVAPISGKYAAARITFSAMEGAQWLDMTGTSNSLTGIRQSVRTQPGMHYELLFHVGNVSGGSFGTTSSVEAQVNDESLGVATNDLVGGGVQQWGRYRMPIIATGDVTTITFINRDARNDNSNGLDAVAFYENLGGEYRYGENGSAMLTHNRNKISLQLTDGPQAGAPAYEAEGKLAGMTITGEWYGKADTKKRFKLVATVLPNGDIELAGSDDPDNTGIKQAVLTLK